MTKGQWTEQENKYLIYSFGHIPLQEICNYLDRTVPSVNNRAVKLDLCRKRFPLSEKDINYIKHHYGKLYIGRIAKNLAIPIHRVKYIGKKFNLKLPKSYISKYCRKRSKGYVCQGYMRIGINGKKWLMHRLVWETRVGKIPEGFFIHHKDGNKLNNKISNLELLSPKAHTKNHYSDSVIDERGRFVGKNSLIK